MTDHSPDPALPQVDDPAVLAEVRAAFDAYEDALVANDLDAMDAAFWRDPRAVRFGIAEELYGHDAIAAWRAGAEPVPASRRLREVRVHGFGPDTAVVTCEFDDDSRAGRGRQSQTWVRLAEGWRIVSAHVSRLAPP